MVNLAELCWYHHRLVHEDGWGLRRGVNGRLVAIRPDGTEFGGADRAAFDHRSIAGSNAARGANVTRRTAIPKWYGDPLEVQWVIDSLWSRGRRAS